MICDPMDSYSNSENIVFIFCAYAHDEELPVCMTFNVNSCHQHVFSDG